MLSEPPVHNTNKTFGVIVLLGIVQRGSLLEWGGAAARPRDANFLREDGAGSGGSVSVRDAGKRAPKASQTHEISLRL